MTAITFGPRAKPEPITPQTWRPSAQGTVYSTDVTSQVSSAGAYAFGSAISPPKATNAYAGWGLIVVYESAIDLQGQVAPIQTVSVIDGIAPSTSKQVLTQANQTLQGVGLVAFEGDIGKKDTASLSAAQPIEELDDPVCAIVDGATQGPDWNGFGVDAQQKMKFQKPAGATTFNLNRGSDGVALAALVVTSQPGAETSPAEPTAS